MIWQNIGMALASIRGSKLRSFLTMLGIIIGVSSVVTVLAAGAGVKQSITDQVASYGSNLLQVNPGKSFTTDESGESSGGFNLAASLGTSTLTENDIQTIRTTPNIAAVVGNIVISGIVQAGDKQAPSAFILATEPDLPKVLNRKVINGQFFTSNDGNVAVIGHKLASDLYGGQQQAIGQTLNLRNQNFTVVGVMEKEKEGGLNLGPSFDEVLYLPFNSGKSIGGGVANILEIDATVSSADNVDATVKDLKERLKANHGGADDFTVLTAEDQLKLFDQILNIMTSFVAAIAAISLLVGGIGVMNIMFVSVTERTREIGIRKAIGATRRNILTQFLIEAVVISLIGGMLGVGLSLLMGLGIKAAADFSPVYSLNAFITAVIISTVVGVVFGTAPAIKAARKNPIEALRYE